MASFEDYVNFFTAVNKQIVLDEEDGESQIKSIYQPVLKMLKEKILQGTIIFLPQCEIAILQVFSAESLLANVSYNIISYTKVYINVYFNFNLFKYIM